MTIKRAYSVSEFCEIYGIGRSKAFEELQEGKLKAKKCGGRTLITFEQAEEWLDNLPMLEPGDK